MAEGVGILIVVLIVALAATIIITGLGIIIMAGASLVLGIVAFFRTLWVGPDQ